MTIGKMVKQLYKAGFINSRQYTDSIPVLQISESFYDTIQGEGIYAGTPAVFMRLTGCTLDCGFCDSKEVFRTGQNVAFHDIFYDFEQHGIIERLQKGHHFVITGGSPLRQQKKLTDFLEEFKERYPFLPFIEVENETVIVPNDRLLKLVSHWNNSPKLSNAHTTNSLYRMEAITRFRELKYGTVSWKFVVARGEDWDEIERNYIEPGYMRRQDIILMPCGASREELALTREIAINLAVEHNVRFMDRLHVVAWDKKTGV